MNRRLIASLIAIIIVSATTLIQHFNDASLWFGIIDDTLFLSQTPLPPTTRTPITKCITWTRETAFNRTVQPIDLWWRNMPSFFRHTTNETHACWIEETNSSAPRREYSYEMYENQYMQNCSRLLYRIMWSSGWGADITAVLGALQEGHRVHHVPTVMGWSPSPRLPNAWHYAANRPRNIKFPNKTVDYSRLNPTCPEKDLSCYFIPYHNCGPLEDLVNDTIKHFFVGNLKGLGIPLDEGDGKYYYEWLSRPLIWFRRAVLDYQREQGLLLRLSANLQQQEEEAQCSVLHVRRADVTLHGSVSRRYFSISEYIDRLPDDANKQHLVLLTDDANAIDEALEFHPNRTWYFYNRTRHRGSSGGWEHQIPSLNPAQEMITMFAIFDLLERHCNHLVYGQSSFAEFLWYYMQRKQQTVFRHRVETNMRRIFLESNKRSEANLANHLAKVRRRRQG